MVKKDREREKERGGRVRKERSKANLVSFSLERSTANGLGRFTHIEKQEAQDSLVCQNVQHIAGQRIDDRQPMDPIVD